MEKRGQEGKRAKVALGSDQRTREARLAGTPSTQRLRACCHVSCTTNMLSLETPVTTKMEHAANMEMGRWRKQMSTTKAISGKDRHICKIASNALRA